MSDARAASGRPSVFPIGSRGYPEFDAGVRCSRRPLSCGRWGWSFWVDAGAVGLARAGIARRHRRERLRPGDVGARVLQIGRSAQAAPGRRVRERPPPCCLRGCRVPALPGCRGRSRCRCTRRASVQCSGARPVVAAPRVGLVRGSAFLPHERVLVVGRLSGEQQAAQSVSAAADGTFLVSLPLRATACAEAFYRARARSARRRRSRSRRPPASPPRLPGQRVAAGTRCPAPSTLHGCLRLRRPERQRVAAELDVAGWRRDHERPRASRHTVEDVNRRHPNRHGDALMRLEARPADHEWALVGDPHLRRCARDRRRRR